MTQQYTKLAAALATITSRVRTDVTAIKTADGRQAWTDEPLTPDRMARHLNGGPARGVCPIKEGESVTMVGLLDLDSHGGEVGWGQMALVGAQVCDVLTMLGGSPVAFKSSGGRGIHLYCLWEDPQDAYSVREWLRGALAGCGLKSGVKGVARGEVEVFPKQDSVPAGGFGSQFILPLAGASVPLEMCELSGMLVEVPGGRDAIVGKRWTMSDVVPVLERASRTTVADAGSGGAGLNAEILSALAVLNDGYDLDYDEWRNVVFAIHHETGGSDEGLALAHEMSARSVLYDPAFLDERVWPYVRSDGRDSAITGRTIVALARTRGWGALSTDTFDVVVPDAAPPGAPAPPPDLPRFTRDRNGVILPTVNNAVLATRRPDVVGVRVGLDEFRDEIMVADEGAPLGDGWRPMRDADMVSMRMELETVGFKSAPKELARDAVVKVCEENRFDSAIVWLSGLEASWEGAERPGVGGCERFLIDYFGCPDTPYVRACSLYLWTALAGRVLDPGCQVDMALILAGDQGLRKSSAVAALVPDPQFFIEVDFGAKEDDTARAMRGALVGEIAELRGLHTRDREAIKKFMTRRHEKWTPKYKEFSTTFPRRIVFVGTVNPTTRGFLDDETGNRRWLPLRVNRADVEGICAARDGLWAEAAELWRAGGVAWQAAEKLAPAAQEEFEVSDDWTGAIADWFDATDGMAGGEGEGMSAVLPRSAFPHTLAEIAAGALGIATRDLGMAVSLRVGAILRKLGFEKHNLRIGGKQGLVWVKGATPC